MTDKPTFVYRDGMNADKEYVQWLSDIKNRYRNSQVRAAVKVNAELLELYWSIGRDLVAMKAEERWGSGIVKQFALDMREAFPDATGFSLSNVKYMKQWYSFYYKQVAKSQRPVGQITSAGKSQQDGDIFLHLVDAKSQRPIDQLDLPEVFGQIPWGQHIDIVSRCKSLEEALFYVRQVVDNRWSRTELNAHIDSNLFIRQGSAVSNFESALPVPQSKLAQEILKDPYNISFLGRKEFQDEKELEELLEHNITRFLLELGQGFAYVGRQIELQMPGGQTYFPDLVFYHIHLKCYIVVELKVVPFKPEFAGKINFYVSAADELLKRDDDNPSIGLIICRSADKTTVEWSFRGIDRPLGVASYQLEEVVARTVAELEQRKESNPDYQQQEIYK